MTCGVNILYPALKFLAIMLHNITTDLNRI